MYSIEHLLVKPAKYLATYLQQESLALASMARDDQHASSMASSTAAAMRSKVGSELKPKLAIMRRCTSVTDGWTDRRTERWTLTSRKMYILHLARKNICTELCLNVSWSFFYHATWHSNSRTRKLFSVEDRVFTDCVSN